ncbi:MAG: DNA repair protein RadA [Oscillospiraceae bacterium]|nr:DNA repair protein RadA [Oscillospiraceae bacterium]
MSKSKMAYICADCGYESAKWNGRCPSCKEWNTMEEYSAPPVAAKGAKAKASAEFSSVSLENQITVLSEIEADGEARYSTGIGELDRVLGGGLVKGSLVLLGGEPGIGKSTILLQICGFLGENQTILYISGEESIRQIKLRADRLGVFTNRLSLLHCSDAASIAGAISAAKPDIAIIDSIQTMAIAEINSSAGSVTQVRECTNLFMRTAKAEEIPIFIVGHVNKDGAIAGPKVMEHIVDAVLYFEGERHLSYRILRAVKNRYGSTNEIGVFEMSGAGLLEVKNPSAMMLSGRAENVSGSCIACIMEGSRPILAEVQALAAKSGFSAPRRTATGFDYNRLSMLLAVLEKRASMFFGTLDVYLNVVGGFKLLEPAGDLAVALSIFSAFYDVPLDGSLTAFGEIGLGGEVRSVTNIAQRLAEAERLGFKRCIIPERSLRGLDVSGFTMEIAGVSSIRQAFGLVKS